MTSRMQTGFRWAVAGAALAAIALAVWLGTRNWSDKPRPDPGSLPFWECATEVGINFKMNFLSDEQGETFVHRPFEVAGLLERLLQVSGLDLRRHMRSRFRFPITYRILR